MAAKDGPRVEEGTVVLVVLVAEEAPVETSHLLPETVEVAELWIVSEEV
jgi:hypothetical protein